MPTPVDAFGEPLFASIRVNLLFNVPKRPPVGQALHFAGIIRIKRQEEVEPAGFFEKPYEPSELLRCIETILAGRENLPAEANPA